MRRARALPSRYAWLRSSFLVTALCTLTALSLFACGDGGGTSTSGAGAGDTTTSNSAGGAGSTTSTTTSGMGGNGGGMVCTPGAEQPCYSGPSGTEGVGLCQAGTETCIEDGSGFGACVGEVTPVAETCGIAGDEDCDGATNEEGSDCVCVPGSMRACYSFDPATEGVGLCHGGTQTCNADGLGYGACMGEIGPAAETCNTPDDDDCDGQTNEEGAGCVCLPDSVNACYTGPTGTEGIGICVAGTATCNADGTALGACMGEVLPAVDDCATPADEDCDGDAPSCTGSHLWSMRFGGGNTQVARSVATDAAGNVLVTGFFQGTVDFGGAPLSSASGSVDAFVVKFDASGNHLWSKRFGDASDQYGFSVATDAAGNLLVTGYFAGTVDFGGGPLTSAGGNDVFVAKLDPAGNHLWSKRFGDASNQNGYGVATDATGNVLVTGALFGTADFGGGPLTSAGGADVFLAKLAP